MKARLYVFFLALFCLAFASSACNDPRRSQTSAVAVANTYGTTSAIGDFAEWTIDSSVTPSTFSVIWNVTDTSGNVTKTMNISGTCEDPDATYHYRTCTVSDSSDSNVAVGGQYQIFEVPGVALFVHPATVDARGSGTGMDELHVGFNLSDCPSSGVAGDYVFTRVLPVSNPFEMEMLGMYRLTGTGVPGQILHAGFSIEENGTSFDIIYNLGDDQGNNQGSFNGVSTFTGSCSGGVVSMTAVGNPNLVERGMLTPSGLFLVDGPQNFGGLVAVRKDDVAAIDDVAGKSLIILWQSSQNGSCSSAAGCTDALKVTFGQKDGTGKVTATFSSLKGQSVPSMAFRAAGDSNAGTRFASVNSGYSNNALSLTYPQPANIPGLLYSDQTDGTNETPTLLVVSKFNGKLLAFGNTSTRTGNGGCLNGTATCDRASGNFVGFEP